MASGHSDGRALRFLYNTAAGRLLLKPLTSRAFSRAAGWLLDSCASKALIAPFVRKNGICMADYIPQDYKSFNAFFTRRIKPEMRPLPEDPACLFAPCDGRLSAYHLSETGEFAIKGSRYDVRALLGGDARAILFEGGECLVFRLCVDDYHRYHYLDSGLKGENHFVPGCLHTVRPIALQSTRVFAQNCREYTYLHTQHFGTVAQVEVGALLVGRIHNNDGRGAFARGAEKGYFCYGGSTVVLIFQKDQIAIDEAYFETTRRGEETRVRLGQTLGQAAQQKE